MIHRFTDNITVLYDGDWAGIKASLRGIDMLLEEGMNIKVMLLPDGEDPDSFARKHNATEFQEYIAAHEVDFIRFKTNLLMNDAKGDPYKRSEVIKDIVKSISVIPEAIVRSEYIKECSQMMHVEERILVSEVAKLKREKEEAQAKSAQREHAPTPQAGTGTSQVTEHAEGTNNGTEPSDMAPHTEDETSYDDFAVGRGAAPSSGIPSSTLSSQLSSLNPLYPKERLIVQQLIRHGEKVMFIDEDTEEKVTVTEYVASELERDEITLTTPLFVEVLQELKQHAGKAGFTAERHFVNHANPTMSRLAVDLIEEKYQLSKYHSKTQNIVNDIDRLKDIVVFLMVDYKHSLVEMELKETQDLLRQPEVMADTDKCLDIMSRCKELMEIKQQMAKYLGDRVIG
jgi:DNA primase